MEEVWLVQLLNSVQSRLAVRVLTCPEPSLSTSKLKPPIPVSPKPLQKPLSMSRGNRSRNRPIPPFRPCICNFPARWKSATTTSRSSKSNLIQLVQCKKVMSIQVFVGFASDLRAMSSMSISIVVPKRRSEYNYTNMFHPD